MKKIKKNNIIIVVGIIIIICSIFIFTNFLQKHHSSKDVYITINNGESVDSVIKKIVDSEIGFNYKDLYQAFNKEKASIYPNRYLLKKNLSADEIVAILNNPHSNIEGDKLLVIEGDNLENIANNLEIASQQRFSYQQIMDYWNDENVLIPLINDYWFLTKDILNPAIRYPLEGYIAPATYTISNDENLASITSKMLDAMESNLEPYKNQNQRQNLSINQFVTLASIVEREAMHDIDRSKIAGVFYNRLKNKMPLQSDITVLYALKQHKEHVSYENLEVDSPYNTYKYNTLPPGPIASVSAKTLAAVSKPDKNDYLYFFALQDSGEVIYSKTLEEHEKVSQEHAWQ